MEEDGGEDCDREEPGAADVGHQSEAPLREPRSRSRSPLPPAEDCSEAVKVEKDWLVRPRISSITPDAFCGGRVAGEKEAIIKHTVDI